MSLTNSLTSSKARRACIARSSAANRSASAFLSSGWESKPVTEKDAKRIREVFSKCQEQQTERPRQKKMREMAGGSP